MRFKRKEQTHAAWRADGGFYPVNGGPPLVAVTNGSLLVPGQSTESNRSVD